MGPAGRQSSDTHVCRCWEPRTRWVFPRGPCLRHSQSAGIGDLETVWARVVTSKYRSLDPRCPAPQEHLLETQIPGHTASLGDQNLYGWCPGMSAGAPDDSRRATFGTDLPGIEKGVINLVGTSLQMSFDLCPRQGCFYSNHVASEQSHRFLGLPFSSSAAAGCADNYGSEVSRPA